MGPRTSVQGQVQWSQSPLHLLTLDLFTTISRLHPARFARLVSGIWTPGRLGRDPARAFSGGDDDNRATTDVGTVEKLFCLNAVL